MSIQVQHLTKIYGDQRAVDDISFEIPTGQVVGFLGPNGAGKSTTMKILTGYIPPTEGTAAVCGYDVEENPLDVKRAVGYLPENNPLYHEMYVVEYLFFIAGVHNVAKPRQRIESLIEITGLTPERKKKIGQLSRGYRQRVGLAQALLHDPEVLILDEPTSGLDPNQLVEIRQLIKSLGREKTVLLSTHIMQEVEAVCDRVIIINKGKIVADDRVENLRNLQHDVVELIVAFKEPVSEDIWQEFPGVVRYRKEGVAWIIEYQGRDDLRETVFHYAVKKGLTLLTLQARTMDLETVFRELTHESETT